MEEENNPPQPRTNENTEIALFHSNMVYYLQLFGESFQPEKVYNDLSEKSKYYHLIGFQYAFRRSKEPNKSQGKPRGVKDHTHPTAKKLFQSFMNIHPLGSQPFNTWTTENWKTIGQMVVSKMKEISRTNRTELEFHLRQQTKEEVKNER